MQKRIIAFIILNLITTPFLIKYSVAPGINSNTREGTIALAKELIEYNNSEKEFFRLRDSLSYHESRYDWTIVNQIGCMGLFQFKQATLHQLGYRISREEFEKNPTVFPPDQQYNALNDLVRANYNALASYQPYVGTVINNVEVTWSGLIAACHLAGSKNVRKYLLTNGKYIYARDGVIEIRTPKKKSNAKDLNGTSISDYMQLFAGFDIKYYLERL